MFSMKQNGSDLIKSTLSQFESVKTKLQEGINLCQESINTNLKTMELLDAENADNDASIVQATNTIEQLDKLLGA
jgi:hypothetical protein